MDADDNLVSEFVNTLRIRHNKTIVSLYGENQCQNESCVEKYEIKDVISGVAKQIKAIHNADSAKTRPRRKGNPNLIKKPNFLPVHNVPLEQPTKQFETQFVLDTQLMDIIEKAEALIDTEKGIAQEFDTTFCYKEKDSCNNDEIFKTNQSRFKQTVNNKGCTSKSEDVSLSSEDGINETTIRNAENGMTQEFDTIFGLNKDLDDCIVKTNDCPKNLESKNPEILKKEYDNNSKENDLLKETFTNLANQYPCDINKLTQIVKNVVTNIAVTHETPRRIKAQREYYDYSYNQGNTSFEDDNNNYMQKEQNNNSECYVEELNNPIISKIESKEKSNTPIPLVFNLDSFEKFETAALPIIENYDFEIAKSVIHTQIMNRKYDEFTSEGVLNDKCKHVFESQKKTVVTDIEYKENKYMIQEDSILFSSDEENNSELTLTCSLNNSFERKSVISEDEMYVGFQTASDKYIKISSDSYCKAKTIFENIDKEDLSKSLTFIKDKDEYCNDIYENHLISKCSDYFHDFNVSDSRRIKFSEEINVKQKTNKVTYDKNLSNIEETNENLSNYTEHLKIDDHILEEFNTDLVPNESLTDSSTIDAKTNNNIILDCDKTPNATEEMETNLIIVNNSSVGFRTANNKIVKVSTQALLKTKNIFENIDDINSRPCNNKSPNIGNVSLQKTRSDSDNLLTRKDRSSKSLLNASKLLSSLTKASSLNFMPSISNKYGQADNKNISAVSKISDTITCQLNNKEILSQKTDNRGEKENEYTNNIVSKPFNLLGGIAPTKELNSVSRLNSNSMLQGFKTASNKPVEISLQAAAKTKIIFQDIDKNEEIYFDSAGDTEIRVRNTKELKPPISEIVKLSSETKDIFQCVSKNDEVFDGGGNLQPSNALKGFTTASNKVIKISESALAKCKNIFQEVDNSEEINNDLFKMPTCTENYNFKGLTTAIPRTEEQLAKCINTSNDIFDNEQMVSNTDKKPQLQGFKTASNKSVNVSKEALSKTNKIFQEIVNKEGESDNFKNFIEDGDFRTLGNPLCQGFKTASNKSVKVSAEALSNTKYILQDIDVEEDKEHSVACNDYNIMTKEKQPCPISNKTKCSIYQGFKTAGNKAVKLSLNALEKSKKIFDKIDTDCKKKEIKEKETILIPKRHIIGFNTASNRQVKISETALYKSRQVFQSNNIDNVNLETRDKLKSPTSFRLQTGKTSHKISDEVLNKSSKILNDLDKSMKVDSNCGGVYCDDKILDLNTEIIKDFEATKCTEDFVKTETPKSKRSSSPILSCTRAKKQKFASPIITNKFIAPINHKSSSKTDINVYKFNEKYKKIKQHTLKDIDKMEEFNKTKNIDPYILNFQFDTLLDFEFAKTRNEVDSDMWTTDRIKTHFTALVNKRIVPENWIENHLRLIIWKLLSYEVRFPAVMENVCTVKNVLEQLYYRYKRELYNVERPALRKILEKDEVSTRRMVLCVAGLYIDGVNVSSVKDLTQNIELLLTDGWYTIKASADKMIDRLVCEGKIRVGTKLVVQGAELVNCEQGVAPWEDTSAVRLKISGNATRRANWDARLGFHGNGAILSHLSAVKPEGGKISQLRVLVTRVYPTLYIEKFPDGSTLTRSERLENIHQMKYETEMQIQIEKLYEELEKISDEESQESEGIDNGAMESGSQISRLMKKSRDREDFRANLTSSQAHLLQEHTIKKKDKQVQVQQEKFRELVKKRGLDLPRNVVPLMKIRVADVDPRGVSKAMLTIWKPNETLQEIIKEGTWIDMYNVCPTSVRYSELQISAGRQSVFRKSKSKKTSIHTLERQCYTIKDLQNPSMSTDYNEIDTFGLIFLIEPSTKEFETKNQPFQNVYLSDEDKNIICVNFWGGIKKFGFENILEYGEVVTCVNMQKRAGNTRKNIPQYRATEFTYFTKTSKLDFVRKQTADLAAKFSSLDKRKFIADCVVLKNNYYNLKLGNIENVSPYRLNTSDYNLSKNKAFIVTPIVNKCTDGNLNLTGLDFDSTFKQMDPQNLSPQMLSRKRKVHEKIARLKMYGEAPPLSPMHIVNKTSNTIKSFKSPCILPPIRIDSNDNSLLNCKETKDSVTNCKTLPQNGIECKTSVTTSHNNKINQGDSSPVLSLNKTNVKRPSINPVKLNFSNANVTSIIDPFDEEFDGSLPLSLDVKYLT